MARDEFGFPVQPPPAAAPGTPAASAANLEGDDPEARRALSLAVTTFALLLASPCTCYLSLLAAIPAGVMAWKASTPLRTRPSPLVRSIGNTALGAGITAVVLGGLGILGMLAYAVFFAWLAWVESQKSDADVSPDEMFEAPPVEPTPVEPEPAEPVPSP